MGRFLQICDVGVILGRKFPQIGISRKIRIKRAVAALSIGYCMYRDQTTPHVHKNWFEIDWYLGGVGVGI